MANTQTTVPLFVANQVLTAAQQNISAGTGTPVFATSVTRDAAFGGSNKALAEGQLCYLESTNVVQYYDGAAWATVGPSTAGGLVFITGASFTTATSVSLPNSTFTSTYKNYKVIFNYVGSDTTSAQTVRLRASGADITAGNYFNGLGVAGYNGTAYNFGSSSGTSWTLNLISSLQMQQEWLIGRPQETTATSITGNAMATVTGAGNSAAYIGGFYNANTSVDSLSLIIGSGATITGFYRVYGLADA